jgi:hypothetical protein
VWLLREQHALCEEEECSQCHRIKALRS